MAISTVPAQVTANTRDDQRAADPHCRQTTTENASAAAATVETANRLMPSSASTLLGRRRSSPCPRIPSVDEHPGLVVVATFDSGMPPEQIETDITGRFERFFTLGSDIDHIEFVLAARRQPHPDLLPPRRRPERGLEPDLEPGACKPAPASPDKWTREGRRVRCARGESLIASHEATG